MTTSPASAGGPSAEPGVDPLFQPLSLGPLTLPHRVLMAPLTRSRASQPGDVPNEMNARYYAQRAGAGLIFSEATQVSPQGKGYAFTPGIHSEEQVAGWRLVTDAVHEKGGLIFLQLWHVGRISHPDLQPNGAPPVAPSAIRPRAQTYVSAESGMVDIPEPRPLEAHELPGVVEQFRLGAQNARNAGFDGVELHAANGYLIDQFLRDGTNRRTDAYGGSIENRLRLPLEVVAAIVDVWGPGRVGVRISPTGTFNDMSDSDPLATFTRFAERLDEHGLAYLEVVEQLFNQEEPDPAQEELSRSLREAFSRVFISNGEYSPETARERIRNALTDAVTFGRAFLANPDLPERIRRGATLNEPDPSTFYGGNEEGYTDYPFLSESEG